jgi:hypothetical protein
MVDVGLRPLITYLAILKGNALTVDDDWRHFDVVLLIVNDDVSDCAALHLLDELLHILAIWIAAPKVLAIDEVYVNVWIPQKHQREC